MPPQNNIKGPSQWTIELPSQAHPQDGSCKIIDDHGNLMLAGVLKNGKMDGEWKAYGSNGDCLVAINYADGVRNGKVEMWYGKVAFPDAKGRLKLAGTFSAGSYHGIVTRYFPTGARTSERQYQYGLITKAQYWSSNGAPESSERSLQLEKEEVAADLGYLSQLEQMVPLSLASSRRKYTE